MKKTKRFAGGGGSGRSSYQGNENSYTQDSDMDASNSVGKGALSRRLAAAAAAREAADMEPTPSRASRDFDAVEAASSMDNMEAEKQRENISPVVSRAMPTRPGQNRSGMAPIAAPTRPGQGRMAPIVAPTRRRGLDMAPSAPNDRAESRSARDAISRLEAESGRAKVREQDARMSMPSAPSAPVDETKLPLSERIKLSRERAGKGSGPTDTRSVNDRFKAMFGMKKGGAVKMASGGSVSSASRRADGIAQKGKTRGKMC